MKAEDEGIRAKNVIACACAFVFLCVYVSLGCGLHIGECVCKMRKEGDNVRGTCAPSCVHLIQRMYHKNKLMHMHGKQSYAREIKECKSA
jgi:hypothetical protein